MWTTGEVFPFPSLSFFSEPSEKKLRVRFNTDFDVLPNGTVLVSDGDVTGRSDDDKDVGAIFTKAFVTQMKVPPTMKIENRNFSIVISS